MKHVRLAVALLALAALGSPMVPAHQEDPAAEDAPTTREVLPSDVREEVQVLLFQLNFLATDKRGRPIDDLAANEIEILDQGTPQRIAFFEPYHSPSRAEVRATSAATTGTTPGPPGEAESPRARPSPGRWILLVFDNYASALPTRVQSLEAAQRWVDEHLEPDDLVAVVSFTGELHILQSFSSDPLILKSALQDAMYETDHAVSDRYRELDFLIEAMARCKERSSPSTCASHLSGAWEDDRRREADALLRALTHLLRSVASIPETKALVLFSDGFARSTTADAIDAARVALGPSVSDSMFFGQEFRVDQRYDELVRAAVDARVSIFTINPGGAARNHLISAERGAPLNEAVDPFQIDVYSRSDGNYQASLGELSRRTGGTSTQRPDMLAALTDIVGLSSGLYSVGYYPSRLDPSDPHDVKIRIKRRGVKAIWPREVPATPPRLPLRGEMTLEPRACTDGKRREVAITVRLEVGSLRFDSVDDRFANDFSLFVSLLDEKGVRTLHRDYRFFNITQDAKGFIQGGLTDPEIEMTLSVPCRPLIVRATAVDAVSGARIDFDRPLPL